MNKADLIRKIAKNVGVPDTDAKIFFELFLKRISAVVDVGQSIFVKEFGYFHLIKGSIKKPLFSFKDNEVSEEEVDLVLFSEDKNLRKSDTKGLVFNIPFFDEEDYHPIDSSFSLSIGKPLIPLRGVPFDNIYIPTSGYEYRRLIESKVEKIIGASEIAESEENFPTLVIDARSYNSNQVQLQWENKDQTETLEQFQNENESGFETKSELSEYEKQTKELKNIEWDFGDDLSKQIEAESILDITDERINIDLNSKVNSNKVPEHATEEKREIQEEVSTEINLTRESYTIAEPEFAEDLVIDDSSEKLNELLENDTKPNEFFEEELVNEIVKENVENIDNEIIIDDQFEEIKSDTSDEIKIEDEISDEEFWKSTSKYYEPYKPGNQKTAEEEFTEVQPTTFNLGEFDSQENEQSNITESEEVNMSVDNQIEDEVNNENSEKDRLDFQDDIKSVRKDNIELEKVSEQKPEFYQEEKKRNLTPFIIFPLLIIIVSIALYWYLEFYKKNGNIIKPKLIVLKFDNAKIVSRNFDFPVTYPYQPKINQTTISETVTPKIEEQNLIADKNEIKKTEEKKPIEKKTETVVPKQNITQIKKTDKSETPTGTALNVGNNIYKYGDNFVVQVASFRASSISENEAGKYRNKGYNAFVETVEIPDRGTWYRVRVGNFSSKEKAQDFISKNIR